MIHNIKKGLSLAVVGLLIAMLASCGGSDDDTSTIPGPGVVGAIASPNPVTATAGAPGQIVTITFQTSSGQGSNLNVPINLPDSWSLTPDEAGLKNYTCNGNPVTSAGGCVLKLVYTPLVSQAQKSFDLTYTYTNNQESQSAKGNLNIEYSAIIGNVVVTNVKPNGLINPIINTTKAVAITFNSNKDRVTNLQVTGLESLPSDWTFTNLESSSYSCASVTDSGSGCQLNLSYHPVKAESGDVVLNYSYVNSTGGIQRSSVTLPYDVSSSNNVVATYPTAVYGKFGESQNISFSFATDDGVAATKLHLDLANLSTTYPGWSYNQESYSCATVDSSCLPLILNYAPESTDKPAQNNLSLSYKYVDKSNETKFGSISLFYKATNESPSDTVVVTKDITGTITTTVGATKQVKVNFNSPVGVTKLVVDKGLVSLATTNPGWSTSDSGFSCATVDRDPSCQLSLFYKPTNVNQYGVVVLGYNYINARGEAQAGTYSISYQPESVNHVILQLGSPSLDATLRNETIFNYSFITDDGRPAYDLTTSIDSPVNFMGSTTPFNCTLVNNAPSTCTNWISYAPYELANGNFTINYTYRNNANQIESGSKVVAYTAQSSSKVKLNLITPDGAPLTSSLPIEASVNESVDLALEFTTYDGSVATNLTLDTTKLPSDSWTVKLDHKTCMRVESKPDLCSMTLNYHPSQIESGKFTLNYKYTDSANKSESAMLTVYYRSLVAWTRVANYQIKQSDMTQDVYSTTMSHMVMDGSGSPMFLVNFLSSNELGRNLVTFNLKNSQLVKTDFLSNITMYTPDLIKDKNGMIYRAYNINGKLNTDSNIVVQKFDGANWGYIGQPTGVFQHQAGFVQTQQVFPSLVFDSHNKLYLNASGFGIPDPLIAPLSVLSYDGGNWSPVGTFSVYPGSIASTSSDLAIDSHDTLYALYRGGISYSEYLFKYNGSFWESVAIPDLVSYNHVRANLFFDKQDNLYLMGEENTYEGNNTLFKYNGLGWTPVGNQDVFNQKGGEYDIVTDKNSNIFIAFNTGEREYYRCHISVYGYNRSTNRWDNLGARSSIKSQCSGNHAMTMGISDDQKTLYLATLVDDTNSTTNTALDLYSYQINQ